jgi:YHS domain-containing protein
MKRVALVLLAGGLLAAGCSKQPESGTAAQREAARAMTQGDVVEIARNGAGPTDPVTGEKVTALDAPVAVFLDRPYRFASQASLERFRARPEEYATTTCPVSDDPVRLREAKLHATYRGRTWYFCCPDCPPSFAADPARYITYRCPTCGMTALRAEATTVTRVFEGADLAFCCQDCLRRFEPQAARFLAVLVPETVGGGSGPAVEAQP